jgi:hypothetical protein
MKALKLSVLAAVLTAAIITSIGGCQRDGQGWWARMKAKRAEARLVPSDSAEVADAPSAAGGSPTLHSSANGTHDAPRTTQDARRARKDYPIQPVPFTQVKLSDDFWAKRIETNCKATIPHVFGQCEKTGRIDNFAIAGGLKQGEHRGDFPFDDTDVYKAIEGAAYCLSVQPDPQLDKYLDNVISLIAAAQEDDGYLYTARTNKCQRLKNWYGDARWERLEGSHELYNMGHLYEAAVAHWQATGKRNLLDVAVKNADLLCREFGPGKIEKWPGHQVIEMGLVKLYRATGNENYLQLAKFFLDVRGPGGNQYNQAHAKPVDQNEAVGHAVRATYMYCGMADVAALTGDQSYQRAIDQIWQDVVGKKLYLTGGIGAVGGGEAFGKPYELPNETAYCETCAAIGNVTWNHRMFLQHGDAKYIDVLERTLYNGLLSGVSLDGKAFFYPNPLASHGQHQRSPWFSCACCPSNITRFIASLPGYVYAQAGKKLYVNMFVAGTSTVQMPRGIVRRTETPVRIEQQTNYPWNGNVQIAVEPNVPTDFELYVRIPGWAQGRCVPSDLYQYVPDMGGVTLKINGKEVRLDMDKGYARIARRWQKGDVVELDMPMLVRRVVAHENVEADRGRVAVERGPIVYCAEGPDNGGRVMSLVLPDEEPLRGDLQADLLDGVTVVRGKAIGLNYGADGEAVMARPHDLVMIPYYAWAHRGRGEMAVWLARDASAAQPATPEGMVPNGSFERARGEVPAGWQKQTYSGKAEFGHVEGGSTTLATSGRTGKRCVMISSTEGADAGWLGTVAVKPNSRYRLIGWIKTENVQAGTGKGALLNLHNIQPLQTPAVTGTQDWTKVEVVFDTGENAVVQINCLLGGWGQSTGKAWFDDVSIESVKAAGPPTADQAPTTVHQIGIDATKTGEPISKYIYGQFIEHLGRCIYGGIWAEMLEDRKFFYAVGAKDSPWAIVGDANCLTMSRVEPYVGEHTPQVQLTGDGKPCGISQPGLGLVEAKEYEGRVILAGVAEALPIHVSLIWGQGDDQRQTVVIADGLGWDRGYVTWPLRFKAGATTDNGCLEIVGRGKGAFKIGTASLMPADNIKGMRADTLKLLKELNSPIYRWPGGNFVSGYDWRLGIGPRDKRPPMRNPAWGGLEHNDFGLDEFIVFCREVGAEPMITVNTGFGDDYSAAQEVEYANGPADTIGGRWRAANGNGQPYGVKWWCVGNEMFGNWQLGHTSLEHYVRKHNLFAGAMRKVDPAIKLMAVGAVGSWSQGMMKSCADNMDLISEHFYRGAQKSVIEHVKQAPESVRQIVDAHREYRKKIDAIKDKDIRVAIDEWNYWYGEHLFGELGTRYFMRDALGIAAGLHEMIRNSDMVFMANYAQTVNVIGAIKTTKTAAAFETTGIVLKLYRNQFGQIPVVIAGEQYPLDVAAALTNDRKTLTVGIVNPTEREYEVPIEVGGVKLTGGGTLWRIADSDPMAYNEPGKEPRVKIEQTPLPAEVVRALKLPAYSVSIYELAAE